MNKKKGFLYWAPRVLAILFILFVALFALDVFGEGYGFFETIIAFFMHLVPNYILVAVLLVAWKHERAGGLMFILLGLFYMVWTWGRGTWMVYLIMSGIPILIGVLFLLNKHVKR